MSTSATATQSQPITRSKSVRQSFGFASVGKALVDAMHHKESRHSSRAPKDTMAAPPKETTIPRRMSNAGPRPSIDRPPSAVPSIKEPVVFPTTAGIGSVTRRTTTRVPQKLVSAPSEDSTRTSDSSASPAEPRRMTRSRTAALAAAPAPAPEKAFSALPKPRTRKDTKAPALAPSPPRPSVRRKLSVSEDDDSSESKDSDGKHSRAISPLPRRMAVKVNLSANINSSLAPPTKPRRPSIPSTTNPRSQSPPSRPPSKTLKKPPPSASNNNIGSSIARPSSAASVRSVSSKPLHAQVPVAAPKERSLRGAFFGRSSPSVKPSGSPEPSATPRQQPVRSDSPPTKPPAKSSQKAHKSSSHGSLLSDVTVTLAAKEPFAGDVSTDSVDVEMMLSMARSPTAATPAMPRVMVRGPSDQPATPSRMEPLARSTLLQLPESPPSSLLLRPQHSSHANDRISVSLDQLAAQGMRQLGEAEMEGMLSDIPAPFPPGVMSPALSQMSFADVPASPALFGFKSPAGPFAQSLSNIVLPEMTPSPAPRRDLFVDTSMSRGGTTPRDDAQATMLRLQVAQAEDVAKQRLTTITALEEQLHAMRDRYGQEAKDLAAHVSRLESELRSNLEARKIADEEHASRMAVLEDQVRHAGAIREQEVAAAIGKAQRAARAQQVAALGREQKRWAMASTANRTAGRWAVVLDVAEAELDLIESNKETLTFLLADIDSRLAQLRPS